MSALDRLKKAETVTATAKAESQPVLNVDKNMVDDYIKAQAEMKDLCLKIDDLGFKMTQEANTLLDSKAQAGDFHKTCRAYGNNGSLRITRTDRWSVAQDQIGEIKNILGNDYPTMVSENRSVSLKKALIENEAELDKFLSKFTDEEIEKYFDVTLKYTMKKDFDQKIFALNEANRGTIRQFVSQAKPSITVE